MSTLFSVRSMRKHWGFFRVPFCSIETIATASGNTVTATETHVVKYIVQSVEVVRAITIVD